MLLTNNEKLVKYNTEDYILKYKGEKKMNQKNLLLSIVALIMIMIVSLLPTTVNAQVSNTPLYLGITELRTNDSPNMGYAIGDPNDNGSGTNATAAKLWNIRELESADDKAPEKTNGNKNIYCIKAGVGFSDTHKSATYNIFYDMKTERTTIPENVINYKNAEITVDEVTVNRYDALLALADMLYLIDGEDNKEERLAYLEANGASNGYPDYADVILTRDDIAAVQQAAIWFFTNSEEGTKFDKREDTTWLNYTLNGNDYEPLTDYHQGEVEGIKDEGYQRNEQANLLYNNLIKKAVQNANNYSGSTSNTGLPVKLNTQTLNYEESNGSYILGPINIAEVSNLPYDINLKIENGSTTINDYKLLNADKQEVAEGTTINDLVGSDFYISVDVDNVETIKLTFGVDYSYNKLTLWTTETAKEQPVMIPEKIEDSENLILEVTPDNEPFDLALRKYITQVNGVNVTNSRVPEIDEGSLQTGTTATYKHRKDPVLVETGSIVTYNITIYNEGEKDIILVRMETSPEDIEGMNLAHGILTLRGGMTSHAAVVARGMGTCCVSGCGDLVIDEENNTLTLKDGRILKEGDYISLDGSTGNVYPGQIKTVEASITGNFGTFMEWADEHRTLEIRANADTPRDALQAKKFGAEGIGLCRTEHMFFDEERIFNFRKMITASDVESREAALEKILPYQRDDFEGLFRAMDDKCVIIRFLDPPLHEFLPKTEEEMKPLAESLGITYETLKNRVDSLKEFNPMMGHRGCRLAITYPEIAKMQTRAVIEAAINVKKEGIEVHPEIMIPLVGILKELQFVKKVVVDTAKEVMDKAGVTVDYKVGTMIEIPRAALLADDIAKEAEFFSFGTNDLTQMTFGFSRDDASKYLNDYYQKGILDQDPFASIDQNGVGKLIDMAATLGRKTRSDLELGICGEHGGDPKSIEFCHKVGLNYVSCSPFRVPVARLAAAQAAINNK